MKDFNLTDLKGKTKKGMVWNVLEKFSVQGVSFILSIVLARLLSPNDYGTIGMLSIFLSFAGVFVDSGFSRALIQKQEKNEYDYSTTFIFNIVVSVSVYLILFIASPAIARFYKTPELLSLQRVFFLVIIINSLYVVQNAKLQIEIDFKSIALINFISVVISGCIGIIAAMKGLEAWSLVIQTLSKYSVTTILYWIKCKWFPHTGFSRNSFKKLFGFGSKLLVSSLLATILNNINDLVIGKIYKPESLGFYSRAQQFPDMTSGTIASVLNNATFPLMASLQNEKEHLLSTFKRLIKLSSMLVFPAMIGIAVLSKQIILVLLGEKWLPSSSLLFWLSLSYLFTPLSILNMNILNAIGRSDLFLKVDASKIPIIIITMIITFPISMKAVVIGKAITSIIYLYINGFMLERLFKFGAIKQLIYVWKEIVSSLVMGVVVYLLTFLISSQTICLIVGITTGVIIYTICLFIFKEEEAFFFMRTIKNHFKGNI